MELSKVGRAFLQGARRAAHHVETEGEMLQRACGELLALKNVVVINDEAHHCYREKPDEDDEDDLKGEDKDEAKKNNEAARLWISGIEALKRKVGRRAPSTTSPPRRSSCAARATPRARCSRGRSPTSR